MFFVISVFIIIHPSVSHTHCLEDIGLILAQRDADRKTDRLGLIGFLIKFSYAGPNRIRLHLGSDNHEFITADTIYFAIVENIREYLSSLLDGGQKDMNDLMINFSEGYDKFIMSMEKEYMELTQRRRRATMLLSKILSIKYPLSRLLYLYYYVNLDPGKISDALYISRATFYRLKSHAINTLTAIYYPHKKNNKAKGNDLEE